MAYQDEIDRVREAYGKGKARFYADPRFAGTVGLVVGFVLGAFFL